MPAVKRGSGKHLIKSDKNPTAENVPKTTQHFTREYERCRHRDVARCRKNMSLVREQYKNRLVVFF